MELEQIKSLAELGSTTVILVIVIITFWRGSKFLVGFFNTFLNNHMKHMQDDMSGMHIAMSEMRDLLKEFINNKK